MRTPRVTLHYAQTLDGRIATRSGQSPWIGPDETRKLQHRLRADHAAVMVGVDTVLADNPRLTVRHVEGPSPLRIVVDSMLHLPLDCILLTDHAAPTLVATTPHASPQRSAAARACGAEILTIPADADGHVDLVHLMQGLWDRGVESVLVEGGQELITGIFRAGLLDRLVVYIAPVLVGIGTDAVGDLGIGAMSEALTFAHSQFTTIGTDIIFEGTINRRERDDS